MIFSGDNSLRSRTGKHRFSVIMGAFLFLLIGVATPVLAQIDMDSFEAKVDFAGGDQPWAMAVGDLDGDGKPDMAVANRVDNTVLLYLNTSSSGTISSGSFGAPSTISVGSGAPRGVDIYDIDGDGKKDLIVSNFDANTLSIFRNTSSVGTISFATSIDISATSGPWGMAFGDVDGDGKPDIAVANRGTTKISVFRNTSGTGSISFASKSDFTTGSGPFNVALGDLDGDGKIDMVTGNRNDNDMSVHRNTSSVGSISFASKVDFTTAGNPAFATIGDVDGDGKAEVLIANSGSSSISVYHNTASSGSISSGSFASKVDFSVGSSPTGIVVVDLDADGKLDLGVNNANSDNISVLRNTASSGSISSSSFATKVDFTAGDAPRKIVASDIDGDEGIDLVVVNSNSDNASVFRSTLGGADEEAPTVSSIAVSGSPVASATSVDFEVTFSESVTGVDISDFSVDGSGVTGTISAISGSGDTYTVTVSSVSGIGTLSIDLNSSGTGIEDGDTNAITDGFTDGGTHMVNTLPTASSVSFSGTLQEGETLTGSYTYSGGYTESGTTFQWYRSDDGSGSNKAVISGATGTTYLVAEADYGKYLSFEVTPSDGTDTGSAVESSIQGAVFNPFADSPTLSYGYKESDTGLQLGFSAPVQTNGGNPGDFTITDVRGSTFAVSAQSDGVAGDHYIRLTVANLSLAVGPLTVTYANNNGEISNLSGTPVLSDATGITISNASAGFDVSEAAFTQLFSITSQVNDPRGIAFNPSGSKMFIAGTHGTSRVVEYSLSTSFDISTASYVNYIDVSSGGMGINEGIAFNDDGTKLFVIDRSIQKVKEYRLSTGFDVSSASYVREFSVAGQETTPLGIAFNPSGNKMFIEGGNGDAVFEYSLSDGFNVSSTSYVQSFSVAGQETEPTGVAFNADGTKMFITGTAGDDVSEYHLDTGFDVSTASYEQRFWVAMQESNVEDVAFSPDGTRMFIVGNGGDEVNEYHLEDTSVPTLSSGQVSSSTQVTVIFNKAVAAYGNNPGDFTLTDSEGTNYSVTGIADAVPGDTELELTVADLNTSVGTLTLTYANNNSEVTDYNNNPAATDETGVTLEYISPTITVAGINGTLEFEETLTGTYTYSGENVESGSTYKWYRSKDGEGTGKSAIDGATELTYVLQIEDIGTYISVEVTPSNGTDTGIPVESALFGPVENTPPEDLTITGDEGWRIITSPGDGASFDSLLSTIWTQGFPGAKTINGSSNVLLWDETARTWSAPEDAGDIPQKGAGFIVYVYGGDDYEGFPKVLSSSAYQHIGEAALTLSFTDTDSLAADGWNLIGNPYGATLDWDAPAGLTRTNLDNTIYVWSDSANGGTGAYLTWNGESGTLSDGNISAWQGFWVKANAESPALTFTDSVRSTGGVFRKEAPVPEFRFTLEGNGMANQAIIMFEEQALVGKDSYDAYKLSSYNARHLALGTSMEKGEVMDLQALPKEFNGAVELAVSMDGSAMNGAFNLSWISTAIPESWKAYLMDAKLKEIIDLRTESAYAFELEGAVRKQGPPIPGRLISRPKVLQTEPEQRFTIVLTSGMVVSNEWFGELPTVIGLSQNYPNPFNPSTVISYQLPLSSEVRLEVFDIVGRKVATLVEERVEAGTHKVIFDGQHLASGVYLYRLITENKVFTKKLTLIK